MAASLIVAASLILAFASSTDAFFWTTSRTDRMFDNWSQLRVRIPSFYTMPRTIDDAVSAGWSKIDDCSTSLKFRGNRYVKQDDTTIMLLFANEGRLAGMQIAIPKDSAPTGDMRSYFIEEANSFTATAYFVDPETICTDKETKFPDMLKFQRGQYSDGNFIEAPMNENDISNVAYPWEEGKCFYLMGKHYWPKPPTRTTCDDSMPFFLLYNGGQLTAFGWMFFGDLQSDYFERPTTSDAERTMINVPRCLYSDRLAGRLRTMHVYLDSPYNNFC